ncbi:MAG: methyl-accepting chemotaxis protein [Holosporales bacterium]|jgi:methyl-accepting chemotaxis protein
MKIQSKFLVISIVSALLVIGLVVAQRWQSIVIKEKTSALSATPTIIQRHMEGDMMHDAMRNDVLGAILANSQGNKDGILKARVDLKLHYEKFFQNIADNKAEPRADQQVKDLFFNSAHALEEYFTAASTVINMIDNGKLYDAEIKSFEQKFEAMEEANESISGMLLEWKDSIEHDIIILENRVGWFFTVGSAFCLLGVVSVPVYAYRQIFSPQRVLIKVMQQLSKHETDVYIIGEKRTDEMGEISRAVAVFRDAIVAMNILQKERETTKAKAEQERRQAMNHLAEAFDAKIGSVVKGVLHAVKDLGCVAEVLAKAAQTASTETTELLQAVEHAGSNVQAVSNAAGEFTGVLKGVSATVANTTTVCRSSAAQVEQSQQHLDKLRNVLSDIDGIVDSIRVITEQTNLLALNATIEASRAGEQGRGFAVVAAEVKVLANKTTEMTVSIDEKINAVKQTASQAIDTTYEIVSCVQEIDASSGKVAISLEEQATTTADISRRSVEAAASINQAVNSIDSVRTAAGQTGDACQHVRSAASVLQEQAQILHDQVQEFLAEVRAA